jgi:hypothetical protein
MSPSEIVSNGTGNLAGYVDTRGTRTIKPQRARYGGAGKPVIKAVSENLSIIQ